MILKQDESGFTIRFNKSPNIDRNADGSDTTGDEKSDERWLPKLYSVFQFKTTSCRFSACLYLLAGRFIFSKESILCQPLLSRHKQERRMGIVSIMDNFFVLLLLGFIVGTFGTLIGAGGGFLLVPLLLITHKHMQPNVVTAISIAVVAANAISGSIAYARAGRIDYKAGLLFGAFTIPGSIAGVFVVNYIPKHLFNILFGILLLLLALFLFIKNNKEDARKPIKIREGKGYRHHELTDNNGEAFSYSYNQNIGIVISILVGFLSPLLGIGGGIIHVPAMVQWLQFPVYIATATSHFILAIMSTVSVVVHICQGSYNDAHVLKMLAGLCIGVVPGAQLGAYISHRIETTLIIRILAICLALVGLRILL